MPHPLRVAEAVTVRRGQLPDGGEPFHAARQLSKVCPHVFDEICAVLSNLPKSEESSV